jgi:outer membrane lipoprotein-sorting protein
MKQFFLLLMATSLILSNTQAQNDPAAKKVLDAVGAKFKSYKGITAKFSIKSFTSKGKLNSTKTGDISIKGQKYVLKQGKTEVLCDATNVYSYDGAKTITVTSVEEGNQTLSPQKLLAGSYDKDFTYKLVSSAGSFHEIEMMPVDKRKSFQKVNLFVDKTKNVITRAKILDKSNNVVDFSFANLNTAAALADNLFVFNKAKYPKDVEILD